MYVDRGTGHNPLRQRILHLILRRTGGDIKEVQVSARLLPRPNILGLAPASTPHPQRRARHVIGKKIVRKRRAKTWKRKLDRVRRFDLSRPPCSVVRRSVVRRSVVRRSVDDVEFATVCPPHRSLHFLGSLIQGGFVGYLGEPSQVAAGGRPLAVAAEGVVSSRT